MTLFSNALAGPTATLPRLAVRAIDIFAAVLAAPPWRGDCAGLHPDHSSAELMGVARIERLISTRRPALSSRD